MARVAADKLRELLMRMDARNGSEAVLAMRDASKLLRSHRLSFKAEDLTPRGKYR
jgi:hypothetical protein